MSKAKTRLGNWLEEIAFEDDKKSLQSQLRANGGLLSQQILAKVEQHLTPCELAVFPDSVLTYGSPIMLQNTFTTGVLAVDLDDRILGPLGWKVNCSTTRQSTPSLRNCWIIRPTGSNKVGEPVCYGHKVLLTSVGDLADPPIYLASEMKTPQSCSKFSKNQETYFSPNGGMGCLWSFEYANTEYREDVVDQPVLITSAVVLKHVATNNFLAASNFHFTNDFGSENEVCCAKFQLYASKAQKAPEKLENFWKIVSRAA